MSEKNKIKVETLVPKSEVDYIRGSLEEGDDTKDGNSRLFSPDFEIGGLTLHAMSEYVAEGCYVQHVLYELTDKMMGDSRIASEVAFTEPEYNDILGVVEFEIENDAEEKLTITIEVIEDPEGE